MMFLCSPNALNLSERKVEITAKNACIDDGSSKHVAIRHGDSNEKETSSLLVNVYLPSTSSGKRMPPPWPESRTLSPSHVALAGDLKVRFESKTETLKIDGESEIAVSTTPTDEYADNPDARYHRLQQANEDTHNLHLKTVQKGSGVIDFSKLLDGINANSDEVVKHELSCKCILNLNTFGDSTFDIMGDCKLIMTETSRENTKHRMIYLFQVRFILRCVFIFKKAAETAHLNHNYSDRI
jgi:hypothetical protein